MGTADSGTSFRDHAGGNLYCFGAEIYRSGQCLYSRNGSIYGRRPPAYNRCASDDPGRDYCSDLRKGTSEEKGSCLILEVIPV